jgi:hypothetical protein
LSGALELNGGRMLYKMKGRIGWQSFGEWAVASAIVTFTMLTMLSIGPFVLPIAVIAVVVAARRNRAWPEAPMGALAGAGTNFLYVAFMNRDSSPCPPGPIHSTLSNGQSFSCGGLDPIPWLTAGALLVVAGVLGYVVSRRILRTAAAHE